MRKSATVRRINHTAEKIVRLVRQQQQGSDYSGAQQVPEGPQLRRFPYQQVDVGYSGAINPGYGESQYPAPQDMAASPELPQPTEPMGEELVQPPLNMRPQQPMMPSPASPIAPAPVVQAMLDLLFSRASSTMPDNPNDGQDEQIEDESNELRDHLGNPDKSNDGEDRKQMLHERMRDDWKQDTSTYPFFWDEVHNPGTALV